MKRVKWVRNQIILQGERQSIGIATYENIFATQFKQARERIKRALSPYFDLTIIPLYKTTVFLSVVRIIILAAVGSAIFMLGTLMILHLREKLEDMPNWIGKIWILSFFWLPVTVKGTIDWRKHRKLNPVWRERIKDVRQSRQAGELN